MLGAETVFSALQMFSLNERNDQTVVRKSRLFPENTPRTRFIERVQLVLIHGDRSTHSAAADVDVQTGGVVFV